MSKSSPDEAVEESDSESSGEPPGQPDDSGDSKPSGPMQDSMAGERKYPRPLR